MNGLTKIIINGSTEVAAEISSVIGAQTGSKTASVICGASVVANNVAALTTAIDEMKCPTKSRRSKILNSIAIASSTGSLATFVVAVAKPVVCSNPVITTLSMIFSTVSGAASSVYVLDNTVDMIDNMELHHEELYDDFEDDTEDDAEDNKEEN